jgi:hypothetical protein
MAGAADIGNAKRASVLDNPSAGWKCSISGVGALAFFLLRSAGALALFAVGCSGPTDPPPPPTGGPILQLDYEMFAAEVIPVLRGNGCNAAGDCHGGGIRGTFELSAIEAVDPMFDFEQASLQVLPVDRAASPLLTKPLAEDAGGVPHSFKPFATRDDAGFVAIRRWIDAGELR